MAEPMVPRALHSCQRDASGAMHPLSVHASHFRRLGHGYRLERRDQKGSDGAIWHGIMVIGQGCDVAPAICLDRFFDRHLDADASKLGTVRHIVVIDIDQRLHFLQIWR